MFPVGDLERNIPKNLIWAKGLGEIVDCQYCGWRHGLAKSSFGRLERLLARHWQTDKSPASIALSPVRMSHYCPGTLLHALRALTRSARRCGDLHSRRQR